LKLRDAVDDLHGDGVAAALGFAAAIRQAAAWLALHVNKLFHLTPPLSLLAVTTPTASIPLFTLASYDYETMTAHTTGNTAQPTLQQSHFFADAAKTGSDLYTSIPQNLWFQRLLFTLQTFAVPLAYYFRPLCTAIAFVW
jgi:hypothetical protein